MDNIQKIINFCLALVVICACVVLAGWYFNIIELKQIVPGFVSMKPNTAIGLMLLSISGWMLYQPNKKVKMFGSLLTFFVLFITVLTLCQYIFNINFGIDEFFFKDADGYMKWPPGRMAPITALNFLCIGMSLILHTANAKKFAKFSQGLVMIAWIASLQALVGYVSGNTYSFGSAYYTQIALHTAILFITLTTAILLMWRNEGYIAYISSEDVAGKVGRKLLLTAIIVPPLINITQARLVQMQYIDADFGVLIRVVGSIVWFAWIAMITSKYLFEVDSKRAEAEQAQHVRTEELQRALQARDDLLSICSHELRTPISSMKLQTQFVKYQIEKGDPTALSPEKMVEVVNQSDRQLDRLTKLIEDMLDFSRLNSGQFELAKEEFDLHDLIVASLDKFKMQLKANQCELKLFFDVEKPILVYWDSYRIEQLVGNLVNNAIKYGSRKPIEVRVFDLPGSTGIQVIDQGLGVKPEDVDRIFQPYERAISVSKISGLGLGLYISKKITEAHEGSIRVESIAGVGSTFTAIIPNRTKPRLKGSLAYGS